MLLADRFLKERPRHPQAAYVQYLRGMADYDRIQSVAERFGVDNSGEDITFARRGFDSFATLIQKYPDSVYVGDARLRMIELRNRMANHELAIINSLHEAPGLAVGGAPGREPARAISRGSLDLRGS